MSSVQSPLVDPHDHVVNFYDDDGHLLDDLTRFVTAGLRSNDIVVLVATQAHRDALDARLVQEGIDGATARASGDYVCLNAAETLLSFMVGDHPDAQRFEAVIGAVIERAASNGRRVRAFGEMVALLWEAGNASAAIELEELWNDLAKKYRFCLYCAYPMTSLVDNGDLLATNEVCQQHSSVIAPLSYGSDPVLPAGGEAADKKDELFLPVESAVAAVRRFVVNTLAGWGENDMIEDAQLVISELATNAVKHANSAFRVSLWRNDVGIRMAVHDASTVHPTRGNLLLEVLSGRGVAMVDQLCSGWGIEEHEDGRGKMVWCELVSRKS